MKILHKTPTLMDNILLPLQTMIKIFLKISYKINLKKPLKSYLPQKKMRKLRKHAKINNKNKQKTNSPAQNNKKHHKVQNNELKTNEIHINKIPKQQKQTKSNPV